MDKEFNVLITGGDTFEEIDEVRKITHMATGRVGTLLVEEFKKAGAKVTFICGALSMLPNCEVDNLIKITGVDSLKEAITNCLNKNQYDAVIHSMAVSDYVVNGLVNTNDLVNEIVNNTFNKTNLNVDQYKQLVKNSIDNSIKIAKGKIDSDMESITISMDRAPKVISIVKELQPETILVGFKLLLNVSENELVNASLKQIKNSKSDYVLATDLNNIFKDKQVSILIDNKGNVINRLNTKQEIAKTICELVTNKLGV